MTYKIGSIGEFAAWTTQVVRNVARIHGHSKLWFDSMTTAERENALGNVMDVKHLMDSPIQIYELRRTCIACPSQWEGRAGEQGSIYVRYRWGVLRAYVSMHELSAAKRGSCIYEEDIGARNGDRLGGYMETGEMQKALQHLCHFNGECDEESCQG